MYKILMLFAIFLHANSDTLPEELTEKCGRFDPNINECLLQQARKWLPHLCNGIRHLNIPSLDPLRINSLAVKYNTTSLEVDAKLPQLALSGHKKAHINNFTLDPETLTGEVKISFPHFKMMGPAIVKAKVLGFPVNNNAFYTWKFDNNDFKFHFTLETVTRDGVEYFHITTLTGDRNVTNVDLDLKSENPRDQRRDNAFVAFVRTNQRRIIAVMDDYQTQIVADMYKIYFNRILERVSANDILPAHDRIIHNTNELNISKTNMHTDTTGA